MIASTMMILLFTVMSNHANSNGRKIQMEMQMPPSRGSRSFGRDSDGYKFTYATEPRRFKKNAEARESGREKRKQEFIQMYGAKNGIIVNDAHHLNTLWWNSADLRSQFPEYHNQPNLEIIGKSADWANELETQNFKIAQRYKEHQLPDKMPNLLGEQFAVSQTRSPIEKFKNTKAERKRRAIAENRRGDEKADTLPANDKTDANPRGFNLNAVPFRPANQMKPAVYSSVGPVTSIISSDYIYQQD